MLTLSFNSPLYLCTFNTVNSNINISIKHSELYLLNKIKLSLSFGGEVPVILLCFFNLLMASECKHTESRFECVKYIKNYDADTVTFNIPNVHPLIGKSVNVRVLGVDTPEIRTKNKCEKTKAKNAKKLVFNLLKNAKRIDLIKIKRGKYFRIVADVIIDGNSLSKYLLKNGLAYAYNGGKKKKMNWCQTQREIANSNN